MTTARALTLAAVALGLGRGGRRDPAGRRRGAARRARRRARSGWTAGSTSRPGSRRPPAGGFLQRDPEQGQPASEPTELRLLFDDHALYAGVRLARLGRAAISRQLSRRDATAEADSFALFLDPHHDHRTGVVLEVSAAGVQRDATLYDDNFEDVTWDAVWESAVDARRPGLDARDPGALLAAALSRGVAEPGG